MSRPIATIDTSVLVSLECAGLVAALSVQFERILVPTMVRAELERGGERNRTALSAISNFAIFENCDDFDSASVRLLLDTRSSLKEGKDEGEAEAIVQAAQRRAHMVLMDDPLGRKWAVNHSLECHGTIWICRELRRTGYLTKLRPYYLKLVQSGRRQPINEMNTFLSEFEEALITRSEHYMP